jgi:chromosomal replication initiator protein
VHGACTPLNCVAEINIARNRYGPVGTVRLGTTDLRFSGFTDFASVRLTQQSEHAPVPTQISTGTETATERKNSKAQQARPHLNPDFTFSNFIGGKANRLALSAAKRVAENPGVAYNPLFIYGGVGLGKTHLIQAIGNQILQRQPHAQVRCIHAEKYVSDVVRTYQHRSFDSFKSYYHSLDLLMIDDIQFFGGKTRTQEEFYFAFNALMESHKQVIITCDSSPREIAGIEERLISRLEGGVGD